MSLEKIIIATRQSPLAMQQAGLIQRQLIIHYPQLSVSLLPLSTQADRFLNVSLTEIGGKGLFVKELEEALQDGRADIAVHSMKDMPVNLPPGLCLPIICFREEVRDALISRNYPDLQALPEGAKVGTSSLRRQTQLLAIAPRLNIQPLRGNIQTRLTRLDQGQFDAIILAAAGLKRMGLEHRISAYFEPEVLLPSAGQGALGIECREDNVAVQELLAFLHHQDTMDCVLAERALARHLGGHCRVPIAAYATLKNGSIHLRALVASIYGETILRAQGTALQSEAEDLGKAVAEELLAQGAEAILRSFYDN